MEVVTELDKELVIDRNKVRRAREENRRLQVDKNETTSLVSVYFDGRIDRTRVYEDGRIKVRREEHISMVEEPNSYYIGHYAPFSEKSIDIVSRLTEFMTSMSITLDNLLAVGCDGAAVNVGRLNGAIRLLENYLGRPLQWLVCLYH